MKPGRIQSSTGHVEPCVNERRPLRKAKYYSVTDSVKYREGKVKRTPGGVKENLKRCAYKLREHFTCVTAYFL